MNRPLLQIGKYKGTFPFQIEASGVYKSTVFSQQFESQASTVILSDSLSDEIWVGNYITSLELQPQTNDIVSEIIDYSTHERVLSLYSAFICLEPERGGEVCYDCLDESHLVGIEDSTEIVDTDSSLIAYPNPFNAQTTIQVNLPKALNSKEMTFRIYNILGQVIRTFNPATTTNQTKFQFIWDGKNDKGMGVATGNYFFVLSSPQKRFTVKLVLKK